MGVRSLGWEDSPGVGWQPTSVFLPGKFHGQRRLAGYCLWGHKESDTTEQLSIHTGLKEFKQQDLGSIPWRSKEDPLEKEMATHSSILA